MSEQNALHSLRLGNGLQIVGQAMPDVESVALAYAIRTGARDEDDPALFGVSHFLEHMHFKGTKTRGWQAFNQALDRVGAENNASTSYEWTVYYLRVVSDYFERAFHLLSEMVMEPRLDESDFEQEKGVIINEIARSEDQPQRYLRRRMMHAYFADHPLGQYVLGSRESIRAMQLAQMRDYWQRRYVVGNMVLSVVGKFEWDHLVELAAQTCHALRTGEAERTLEPYEPAAAARHILVDERLKQQLITISLPTVSAEDPEYEAAWLGSTVLGYPDGSRLYWTIRQKGLAELASSSLWAFDGTGLMFVEASTTPEQAPQVLRLLRAELERLLNNGIEEDELRRAKAKRIAALVFESESTYSRMRTLANDWLYQGRVYSLDEQIERIERVSREEVMRTLRRFPLLEKQVLTTLGPLGEEQLVS